MPTRNPRRQSSRRYITLVILVVALFGGWSGFWYYASREAQATVEAWRAREAKAGRVYACGTQELAGYPFRFELTCDRASAVFRGVAPPVEIKTDSILVAAQVYQPNLLISEFKGPLTVSAPGAPPNLIANWKLAQASVRGSPAAPERVALVFDTPTVERVSEGVRRAWMRAGHVEIHGRIAEGSAANKPVIETALQFAAASLPGFHAAATDPIDGEIIGRLHGLNDFSPKPWSARFREIQAAGGRIDITKARLQQGDILAVGSGQLSLDAVGRLTGELNVTIAGLDQFLEKIGARELVQKSPAMDRLAGALDRLAPGLGGLARQQASANVSAGINMLGEQATLEGRRAVRLPLRFNDGSVFLGPIPIGNTPPLF